MAETSEVENSGAISGRELVPQPHGGALLRGGLPGHKGGPGRPPNQVRQLACLGFGVAIEMVCERLAQKNLSNQDLVRLAELLGKYGPGTKLEFSDQVPGVLASVLVKYDGKTLSREVAFEMIRDLAEMLGSPESVLLQPPSSEVMREEAILIAAEEIRAQRAWVAGQ